MGALVDAKCDWCGLVFQKKPWELHDHNFCCRSHFNMWNAKRISEYNVTENEMNKPSGWGEVRKRAQREARLGTKIKGYRKYHQQHEHRVVAESVIGRKLLPGEVVHHIDGDKSNNSPENLMVFPSQREHALWHAQHQRR